MTYTLSDLKTEIYIHPRERKGFDQTCILQIPHYDLPQAVELLLTALEEGRHRCAQPLQWLLQNQYIPQLINRRLKFTQDQEPYFFLTFALFEASHEGHYLEDMKQSLLLADTNWEMTSTALQRITNGTLPDKIALINYCQQVLLNSANASLRKSALINILECKNLNPLKDGLSDRDLLIIQHLDSPVRTDKDWATIELNKIISTP